MKIKAIKSPTHLLVRMAGPDDRSFAIGLRDRSSKPEFGNYVIMYTHGWDDMPHKLGLFEYNLSPGHVIIFTLPSPLD